MLKSQDVIIHHLTSDIAAKSGEDNEAIESRLPFYFRAFIENYDHILWAKMDIKRDAVDEMLGIVRD